MRTSSDRATGTAGTVGRRCVGLARRSAASVGAVVAVVLVATACTSPVAGSGQLDAAALPSPDPNCPGKIVPVQRHDDVEAAVVATSPRGLPQDAKNSKAQPIDVVLEDFTDDRAEARRELTEARYIGGYQRAWSTGTAGQAGRQVELLVVYEFGSADGACRFFGWLTKTLELKPVPSADLPGAVGLASTPTGRIRTASVYASKGPYLIFAAALVYSNDDVNARASSLIRGQFSRL
jgi:hypothetical protein